MVCGSGFPAAIVFILAKLIAAGPAKGRRDASKFRSHNAVDSMVIFDVVSLRLIRFFRSAQGHNYAVSKSENQRTADQDNEIGGKKGHNENKRIFQIIGAYQQLNTVI